MTERPQTSYYLPEGMPQPAPAADGLDAPYWEATRRHELVIQQCQACEELQWEPEWLCRSCQSFDLTWRAVSGRGTVFSWERVWHPVHPALHTGVPYLAVLVELAESGDVRMIGNLVGDPHQEVEIGVDVRAVFEDHADEGYTLVQWEVVGAPSA